MVKHENSTVKNVLVSIGVNRQINMLVKGKCENSTDGASSKK